VRFVNLVHLRVFYFFFSVFDSFSLRSCIWLNVDALSYKCIELSRQSACSIECVNALSIDWRVVERTCVYA